MPQPDLGIVVVAGGSSSRMGGVDKIFASLGGMPVVAHCLDAFQSSPLVRDVSLVLSGDNIEQGRALVAGRGLGKVRTIVTGGARRQDSARLGLEALLESGSAPDYVAVHDGPRPFVGEDLLQRGRAAVEQSGAAVPALPLTDTVKQIDARGAVTATPSRSSLRAVQTPQFFETAILLKAHREIAGDVTDDAMMVERIGGAVTVFEGSTDNIKITNPEDLALAEHILERRAMRQSGASADPALRWGAGFDGHALKAGTPLRLGGLDIPFDMGLEGHSDGDVLLHAIASAILGAAGLGDLGAHFPSTSDEWADADSRGIVRECARMAAAAGWGVDYLDATIVAQRPRLSPHLPGIRSSVAETLGIAADRVNIKATSTDHVGAIGEGIGIAAQAIATLRAR